MTTLNLQVSASADDCFENDVGDTDITDTSAVSDQTDEYHGFRWQNVTIPQGATIDGTTFQVYVSGSTVDEPYHQIYNEAADNAAEFVTDSLGGNNISSRAVSTAVLWDNADLGSSGGFATTASPINQVQSVINRAGWSSGNSLVLIINGYTGIPLTRDLGIDYYDLSSARGAKLDITYSAGDTGTNQAFTENGVQMTVINRVTVAEPY